MIKSIYVIDDQQTPYVENVIELLTNNGFDVKHLENIILARASIEDICKSTLIILDLMMPEMDETKVIPDDPASVGTDFLELLHSHNCKAKIVISTNARKERHRTNINKIETSYIDNLKPEITYKYDTSSTEFVNYLISEIE